MSAGSLKQPTPEIIFRSWYFLEIVSCVWDILKKQICAKHAKVRKFILLCCSRQKTLQSGKSGLFLAILRRCLPARASLPPRHPAARFFPLVSPLRVSFPSSPARAFLSPRLPAACFFPSRHPAQAFFILVTPHERSEDAGPSVSNQSTKTPERDKALGHFSVSVHLHCEQSAQLSK